MHLTKGIRVIILHKSKKSMEKLSKPEIPHNRDRDLIALLNRFDNGEVQFHNSVLFRQVIIALVEGADIYSLLNGLIKITEDMQNEVIRVIETSTKAHIIIPPDARIIELLKEKKK